MNNKTDEFPVSPDGSVQGRKQDSHKLRYDLLPDWPVQAIVEVLTFGARKYAPNNWKFVSDGQTRYYAALQRHLAAWRMGEKLDPESGLSHLAHAGCCLLFLLAFDGARKENS
jgi:hypothetical protein